MNDVDVVVVGAGIAGLVAAREIVRSGGRVAVLEARDRVAGRTDHHVTAAGETLEMGGQWVGPTQTEVLALIEELGLTTYRQYEAGDNVNILPGNDEPVIGDRAAAALAAIAPEVPQVQARLEALAETVSLASPWLTEDAAHLDSMTLESWLLSQTSDPATLDYWRILTAALFCAEPAEMSLLHYLFYIKSGGMLESLTSMGGGAQESRIVGGSHLISVRMAEELGDAVQLGSPVHTISQDADGVVVAYDGGEIRAERVVVAVPPVLAGRLRYQPAMPVVRDALTQQMPMGSVIKVQAVYATPFWRDAGLNGHAFSMDDPLSVVMDNTPHGSDRGVLVGFFEGPHARELSVLSQAERQAVAVRCLVRFFGPAAAEVVEYIDKDWIAEEYTRGCYGGRLGAGVWTRYGSALAEPVGRIHWAGAETASVWNGYMDGAVRSGKRAAGDVLAALPDAVSRW